MRNFCITIGLHWAALWSQGMSPSVNTRQCLSATLLAVTSRITAMPTTCQNLYSVKCILTHAKVNKSSLRAIS